MFVPGRDRANQVSELGGVVGDVPYRIDDEWKTTRNEGRAGLSRRVPPSSRAPDRRQSTAAVDAAQQAKPFRLLVVVFSAVRFD